MSPALPSEPAMQPKAVLPGLAVLPRRIVAAGEAMVEMAPTGAAPGTYAMGFAGDTLNTAWYLRRLLGAAWSVDYATALGTDAVSDRMLAFLAAAGLGTAHVERRQDRTPGLYLIELTGAERSFAYWRGQSAARLLAADPARLDRAFAAAGLVYVSGISLAVLEGAGRDNLLSALARVRQAGTLIAFDPNLRPRLWESGDVMRATIMQAAALADIALPSHDDEATHFGDASPEATAARYAGAGARVVVVKNGAGDVVALSPAGPLRRPARQVADVVDTTAAGDSFNAGFLTALLEGADMPAAVDRGARVAARVIAARGALVAIDPPGNGD